MKNYISFVGFMMVHHKQLFLATALFLTLAGATPPGTL